MPLRLSLIHIFLVIISWVIFGFDDVSRGISFLGAMFGLNGAGFLNGESIYLLYTNLLIFAALFFASMDWGKKLWSKLQNMLQKHMAAFEVIRNIAFVAVFVLSVAYLVNASYNPFLYFRF